jgi:hypothetical protein
MTTTTYLKYYSANEITTTTYLKYYSANEMMTTKLSVALEAGPPHKNDIPV